MRLIDSLSREKAIVAQRFRSHPAGPLEMHYLAACRACKVCGCDETNRCLIGEDISGLPITCHWINADRCSACHQSSKEVYNEGFQSPR